MIIDRSIKKYIIYDEDPIHRAFEKINDNNMRIIFVVDECGVLEGVLTDGDLRRWILDQKQIDLQQPVSAASNTNFSSCHDNESPEKIEGFFSSRVEYMPLVDERNRLVAVATQRQPVFTIGRHTISDESPVFIIAEIGNNHNGDMEMARQLVKKAVQAGADCVKFQMRHLDDLYNNAGDANDASEDLGSQYVLDLLVRFQLEDKQLADIFDYCRELGVVPLCTPWDKNSMEFLEEYGMEAYKVASADLTNHDLLQDIAATGKPMICSTGMSTEAEITSSVELLRSKGAQFILLHCNSTYPAPFKDINLRYLKRLQGISSFPVGYSGHERGGDIAIAAVAMGAKVIEKHFTLDRSLEGNDHKISLLPEEFRQMVDGIRAVECALGTTGSRYVTQGELINRESLAKSLVINCSLKEGEYITNGMVSVKSPGRGLPPYKRQELVGRKALRDFAPGDFFYPEDLQDKVVEPREYKFIHPFGVPVRYHDLRQIVDLCPLDLVEIHLSYKDLEVDLQQFFDKPLSKQLVVHSPELFRGDHVLDLTSEVQEYRNRSIKEIQKVINVTRQLKKFFPKTAKPPIVVNVGGFSADSFIDEESKKIKYELLLDSLGEINQNGIELIPQTMPPYPWHFGGQRFHNLFVRSDEIMDFCLKNKYRICLDVSHSKLACNLDDLSLIDFVEKVAPVTAHLHIADASGVDGEGLQIGDGEMDFSVLMKKLAEVMPKASFIPEIWQGHKNKGQGFWIALDRLEQCWKLGR